MTAAYGFRITCDVVAIICFVFAVAYFFIGNGPQAIRLSCENYRLEKAKETMPTTPDHIQDTLS